ncbi:flagellar motor protein MotB [Niastella caeni]|uniref:Flagellar motor protein MotB n=1 Tax=Niastella caeni TaxID=2569763 RepID=A0A4S8HUJ1_9BACT|nr:OmpA family protein [Niastella caeni]THU39277.1 flagellar motor protein MotB [Niastella caeni]
MKKIILILGVVPAFIMARGQFVQDYLKAADNYYKKGDYYSAALYYEKYLGTKGSKASRADYNPYNVKPASGVVKAVTSSAQLAVYNLAESYRLLNFPVKAVAYYEQALSYKNSQLPLAQYYYASTLRALGKYDEAEKAFQLFLDNYKADDVYTNSARSEVLNLHFIREQLRRTDLPLFTVEKQGATINPGGANYSPVWLNKNTLLFTSTRPEGDAKDKPFFNRLFEAVYDKGAVKNVNKVEIPQGAGIHQGVVSSTPDGKVLFLTRWSIVNGKKTSAIYTSKKHGKAWSEPVLVDALVNAPGYNSQQPFVMPDGKSLLFASDKPGGSGGFDLWCATLGANGKPEKVVNLGNTINTLNDEQAPYYHEASGTLVFSCNGRIGMGGFDFFYSKGAMNAWAIPVNFGYPVNSIKDDIYFTSRGTAKNILEDVIISSDRLAECCLELFSLKKKRSPKQINGLIAACSDRSLLSGVSVSIIDTINNKTVYTTTTGADGSYAFAMEEFQPLKAVATLPGFKSDSLQFNMPDEGADKDSLTNPVICLVREQPPVEAVIVMDNVYYDFDKSSLRQESFPALDKLIGLLNEYPTMVIEIRAHTDDRGTETYNMNLSEARAAKVVAYLVSKGIDKGRLQSKGYGATLPVAPNKHEDGSDDAEGRQRNRRTEFKVLGK